MTTTDVQGPAADTNHEAAAEPSSVQAPQAKKVGRVVILREALSKALNAVSMAVPTRTPRPQFMCIRMEAKKLSKKSVLTLAATDAEVWIEQVIDDADVTGDGACLVPAAELRSIVNASISETLTFELKPDGAVIRDMDGTFELLGYDPKELPPMPALKREEYDIFVSEASIGDFLACLDRTKYAISAETSRYAMAALLLKFDGKSMVTAATDGRRLSVAAVDMECTETPGILIGSKTIGILQKMLSGAGGKFSFAASKTMFKAKLENEDGSSLSMASNLIEGTFPPYAEIVPKDHAIVAKVSRVLLQSAMKRALILTNAESRGVRMAFDPDKKTLTVSSRAPERGSASMECPISEYQGEKIEIAFDPRFILQAIEPMSDERVKIEMVAYNKPAVFRHGGFFCMIMPMNLV